MLGEALIDTHGIDGNAPGLGLLPLVTQFEPVKTVNHTQLTLGPLTGPWSALAGLAVQGYEIHHGVTTPHPAMLAGGHGLQCVAPGLAWADASGRVLGLYWHGLFEDPAVLQALFGAATPTLNHVFDHLADTLAQNSLPGALDALIQP